LIVRTERHRGVPKRRSADARGGVLPRLGRSRLDAQGKAGLDGGFETN